MHLCNSLHRAFGLIILSTGFLSPCLALSMAVSASDEATLRAAIVNRAPGIELTVALQKNIVLGSKISVKAAQSPINSNVGSMPSLTILGNSRMVSVSGSGPAPCFEVEPGAEVHFQSVILTGSAESSIVVGNVGSQSGAAAVFVDCKFLNGRAVDGAGLKVSGGSKATLRNCLFVGNIASSRGGGIYNEERSEVRLLNCVFRTNSAAVAGTSLYNSVSTVVITVAEFWCADSAVACIAHQSGAWSSAGLRLYDSVGAKRSVVAGGSGGGVLLGGESGFGAYCSPDCGAGFYGNCTFFKTRNPLCHYNCECVPCKANRFSRVSGATESYVCEQCPEGTGSHRGSASCDLAEAGYFLRPNADEFDNLNDDRVFLKPTSCPEGGLCDGAGKL